MRQRLRDEGTIDRNHIYYMESKHNLGNVRSKIQSELETGGLDELDVVGGRDLR